MTSEGTRQNGDEARLWLAALLVSVVINGLLLGCLSYRAITVKMDRRSILTKPQTESVATIFPEMFVEDSAKDKPAVTEPEAVRTSDDQISPEAPSSRRYIGERNTQATSDRAATSDDANMPSQAGRELLPSEDIETTESVYQDGRLDTAIQSNTPSPPASLPGELPAPLSLSAEKIKGKTQSDPGEAEIAETAIRDNLLDGPNITEKEVTSGEVKENIKPRDAKKTRDGDPEGLAVKKPEDQTKPTTQPPSSQIKDPAFRGNQSKTAIHGSISRTGRSALDVVDTPMGRYHAQISRSVELAWQRNCVKRRDFIVPGYLTARFFLDADGSVTKINLIGEIEGGEIQKGFTLDSIREAEIPAMPPKVKEEMEGDSLELIFNFYF